MTDDRDLSLATWNIHMGIGSDGRRDLDRTVAVIREIGPDLIALQEVDNHVGDSGDDLGRLQDATGMEIIAGPTMQRPTGDYGNALLTRLPVRDVERHDLSIDRREPRGLLIVYVETSGGLLQVAVTHLGLAWQERRHQVRRLIEFLSTGDRAPLILMGDFNEWFFLGRPLSWLHRHFGRGRSPRTFPARWPLLRLDHIFCMPPMRLHALRTHATPLARHASDHLPLVAQYRCDAS